MKKGNHRENKIHFHQWSRKAYAIFVSLGRDVKICRLSVSMCEKSILKLDNIISELAVPSVKEKKEEDKDVALGNSVELNLCTETRDKEDCIFVKNKNNYIKGYKV